MTRSTGSMGRPRSRKGRARLATKPHASGTRPISVSPTATPISTVFDTLFVQQYVAGAVDFGGEIAGAAVVWMEFDHQAAMRLLDRLGVGAGREAEDGIGLLDRHVAAARPGAAGAPGPSRATPGPTKFVAPIGTDAVEISFEQPRSFLIFGPALAQQCQQVGRPQLVEPHAGEAAAQDRPLHPPSVMVERHAKECCRYRRGLTARRSAVAVENAAEAREQWGRHCQRQQQ